LVAQYSRAYVPSTGRRAFFTKPSTTKFATEESTTACTYNFAAIFALIHFVAALAVKAVTSIANSNLVIGLIFVTPVTFVANIGAAFVAADLHVVFGGVFRVAVQTTVAVAYSRELRLHRRYEHAPAIGSVGDGGTTYECLHGCVVYATVLIAVVGGTVAWAFDEIRRIPTVKVLGQRAFGSNRHTVYVYVCAFLSECACLFKCTGGIFQSRHE
jgi:hypothetical protein